MFYLWNRTKSDVSMHEDNGRLVARGPFLTIELVEQQIIETTSQPVPPDDPVERLAVAQYKQRAGRSV